MPKITNINWIDWLLPLLAGVGLFFINIKAFPDWGDDFAQYLQEARNLATDKEISQSSYIFNPQFKRIGPQMYPPGFPILLQPFYQNDFAVIPLQYYLSAWASLLGLISFLFWRHLEVPRAGATLLTVLLLYHPQLVSLKAHIISDIPFSALFMAVMWLWVRAKKPLQFLAVGLLAGLSISVRSIGWVIPLTSFIWMLYQVVRHKDFSALKTHGLLTLGATLGAALINLGTGYWNYASRGYGLLFKEGSIFGNVMTNALHYWDVFIRLFHAPGNNSWIMVLDIVQGMAIILLIIGLISRLKKGLNKPEVAVFIYLVVIMLYPYGGGYRFLLPILPILIFWLYCGTQILHPKLQVTISAIFGTVLIISYTPELRLYKKTESIAWRSPYRPESKEFFDYMKHLDSSKTTLFLKPRALAYFTGQNSVATEPECSLSEFRMALEKFEVQYLVQSQDIPYPALKQYLHENSELKAVYENWRFQVYALK